MAGKLMHAIQYDSYDGGPAALKVFFYLAFLLYVSFPSVFFLISLLVLYVFMADLFSPFEGFFFCIVI